MPMLLWLLKGSDHKAYNVHPWISQKYRTP